ncbi:MAG: hypothetical protein D3905_06510 [Candidatus Electrothrix sp. AS4_5]|nr:hypothetical protein [Candidatus Electrothrix gigas]
MNTVSKEPIGAAVFTRKTEYGSNYNWEHAQTSTFQLLDKAKKVFETVLSKDSVITERTMFAVIQKGKRIGIVVAHLPTSRHDSNGGSISTTLYIEFAASDKADVVQGVAALLNSSSQEHSFLVDYAEDVFKNPPDGSPRPIQLPVWTNSRITLTRFIKRKGLIYSPVNERNQYANYVARLPKNFCFVSTGYVNQSKYQELEGAFKGRLLVLTLTDTGKKNRSWQLPYRKMAVSLVIMVLVLSAVALIYKFTEQQVEETKREPGLGDQTPPLQPVEQKTESTHIEEEPSVEQDQTVDQQISDEKLQTAKTDLDNLKEDEEEASVGEDRTVDQQISDEIADKKLQEAKNDLDNFLKEDAFNTKNYTRGTIEKYLKSNKDNPTSHYQVQYCPDFLEKYHSLKDLIEQNKEQPNMPEAPENYCAKYDLDNFLKKRALNSQNLLTSGNIEEHLKQNKDDPQSFYQRKYCLNFLKKYYSLKKFIEQNKEQPNMPEAPENYCEKYEQNLQNSENSAEEHITRLENDQSYSDCVVLSESIKELERITVKAKRLLMTGRMTKSEYKTLLDDVHHNKISLKKFQKEKKCN